MGIPGIIAIVSKNKQLTIWDGPFIVISWRSSDIGFSQWDAIDTDNAIMHRNRFARQADDSFDQVFLGVDWKDEDNDIATMRLASLIRKFIDKDIFAILQGGSHAKAIHPDAS